MHGQQWPFRTQNKTSYKEVGRLTWARVPSCIACWVLRALCWRREHSSCERKSSASAAIQRLRRSSSSGSMCVLSSASQQYCCEGFCDWHMPRCCACSPLYYSSAALSAPMIGICDVAVPFANVFRSWRILGAIRRQVGILTCTHKI